VPSLSAGDDGQKERTEDQRGLDDHRAHFQPSADPVHLDPYDQHQRKDGGADREQDRRPVAPKR
jgi:hypothetical protein